ncbi:hypothetical protein ACJRO7_015429 [Eucalyptus globulus]|uniref:TIR domain-containing protein n=1 Tax=Eucalyptus globulus TaxID=34317 RepID=A0ABD3L9A0_EUCGL
MAPIMERDSGSRIEYEVFLSFRGSDSCQTFTDCLYEGMKGAGIRVFKDDDDLRAGQKIKEELPRAIQNSRIYMPILSRNYASSKWCLIELATMVEMASKSNGTKEILPIYLDVNSDDVKLKTPLYRDVFVQHETNFDADQVKVWRDALLEVEEIKRLNLKNYRGYRELIKVIIQEVLVKLNAKYKNLTEHLVEDHVQVDAIMKLLSVDFRGVRFMGIHGIGGIGKTTLAKVIYNKVSSCFDRCSFLENIREISRRSDGLVHLQKQLLSSILDLRFSSDTFIRDVDQGIDMIKKALCDKKMLIVLDDVDEKDQLEKLVGKSDWFENGSRVIITTRNTSIVTDRMETLEVDPPRYRHGGILSYEVKEMGFGQALQLFCRHSFRRDSPTEDYDSLSRQIVSALGKLPLAIEVIGSSLSGVSTDKASWEETLKKLQKVPPKKVQETLIISYEGLEPTQRKIFLDITCFFIKENKKYPIFIWSDHEYYPRDAIRVLLRSLIKIGDDNKFSMHDQVRDLGRHNVYEENCRFPGKRSRVWNPEEALNLLRNKQSLRSLRFLRGKGLNFVGNFKDHCELRWLSWHECPPNFTATNFCLVNLVVLDLSKSKITEDWIGWNQIKMAKKLKVLDLRSCNCLRSTPDLSNFASLETLILAWCSKLATIDRSIINLQNLSTLNMEGCNSLHELSEEVGSLKSLTELIMPKHSLLCKLPETIGNWQSLSSLSIKWNERISRLPHSIGVLAKIKHLSIEGCKGIKELPPSLGELESLIELDLSFSGVVNVPDSITNLRKLKFIRMGNTKIGKLPNAIGRLEMLEELHCIECQHLSDEIPCSIGELSHLRILDVSGTRIPGLPATMSHLPCLKQLELKECHELRQLPKLPSSLTSLTIDVYYYQITPDLTNLVNLEHLDLSFHRDSHGGTGKWKELLSLWKNLKSIHRLPSSLSTLKLTDITPLPQFSSFRNLSKLSVSSCLMTHFPALEHLENLRELSVEKSTSLVGMPDLSNLKNLEILHLSDLQELVEVQGMGELESLESLKITCCGSIEILPNLSKLGKLKHFNLECCSGLRCIEGLSGLRHLTHVTLKDCESLQGLPDLPRGAKLDTDWESP